QSAFSIDLLGDKDRDGAPLLAVEIGKCTLTLTRQESRALGDLIEDIIRHRSAMATSTRWMFHTMWRVNVEIARCSRDLVVTTHDAAANKKVRANISPADALRLVENLAVASEAAFVESDCADTEDKMEFMAATRKGAYIADRFGALT